MAVPGEEEIAAWTAQLQDESRRQQLVASGTLERCVQSLEPIVKAWWATCMHTLSM